VGVLVVGCHTKSEGPKVTQEQLAEIGKIFAASDASSGAVETAFQTAVKTVDAVAPGATPCAVPFTLDDDSRVAEQLASQLPTASIAHSTVRVGTATITGDRSQLATLTSASVETRHEEEERLLDRVDDYAALDGAALVARAHQLAAQPLPTELLIVITAGRDPTLATGDTFNGGVALAHAYLYSPAERRFVCAGNVSAESSGAVNTFLNPKDPTGKSDPNLTADLYLNLIEETQHSLRATP
jgi:hypothetical protein